jgi:hypothetical protein
MTQCACFNDALFPGIGIATTQLLERLGHTVVFPQTQACCVQMYFNRFCCKNPDALVNSALFREEQRSFQHEYSRFVQMASF